MLRSPVQLPHDPSDDQDDEYDEDGSCPESDLQYIPDQFAPRQREWKHDQDEDWNKLLYPVHSK
jgi:hypothetical protein